MQDGPTPLEERVSGWLGWFALMAYVGLGIAYWRLSFSPAVVRGNGSEEDGFFIAVALWPAWLVCEIVMKTVYKGRTGTQREKGKER